MNARTAQYEIRALCAALPPNLAGPHLPVFRARPAAPTGWPARLDQPWREALALLEEHVPFTRRMMHSGDLVHRDGEPCTVLHIVNSGMVRSVKVSADGREQIVGLQFKGDWLGFEGIASGRYGCDAIAMGTGEIWTFRYDTLLHICATVPALMAVMHAAMSDQIVRDRDSLLSLGTLPADARVANFLKVWAESLHERNLRTDQIALHMSRAEIGTTLGMTLETVSRALCRMARQGVIRFNEKGRRDIGIPSVEALDDFIQEALARRDPVLRQGVPPPLCPTSGVRPASTWARQMSYSARSDLIRPADLDARPRN
jgi:CRP/FNR family transcriptional regulator, anaerobic regulatory protein